MTAFDMVIKKGYNPFKTVLVEEKGIYKVVDKETNKVIVVFTYDENGNHEIL